MSRNSSTSRNGRSASRNRYPTPAHQLNDRYGVDRRNLRSTTALLAKYENEALEQERARSASRRRATGGFPLPPGGVAQPGASAPPFAHLYQGPNSARNQSSFPNGASSSSAVVPPFLGAPVL
ncbi:unnamed protein product, partial [Amoebophrya sp. A120]|eukprot:GSA120T00005741001.1